MRKMVLVNLAILCLMTMLLFVNPTRSQTSQYDPWLDINGDGTIDGSDLIGGCRAFGTAGDPTKNVNVTNWPTNWPQTYNLQNGTMNFSSTGYNLYAIISCGGYSRMSLLLAANVSNLGSGHITIYLPTIIWGKDSSVNPYEGVSYESLDFNTFNITIYPFAFIFPKSYLTETKAPYCKLGFGITADSNLPADWWVTVKYVAYLRNE